ncbi:hypothetical protein MAHJHV61_13540 [Mycobacterium avium subsp. hominissuis]
MSTARIDATASADRENSSATDCPGPAPRPASKCANLFDASSSCRYVSERPSHTSATSCGARATCVAKSSGTDTAGPGVRVRTAVLPSASSCACSGSRSTSNDDSSRAGSAAMAARMRCNRSARSVASKFANGCPVPTVLRNCWSPNPRKNSPKCPTGPKLVYVAVAGKSARLRVRRAGTKLTTTRFGACLGPLKSPSPSSVRVGNC